MSGNYQNSPGNSNSELKLCDGEKKTNLDDRAPFSLSVSYFHVKKKDTLFHLEFKI